MSGRTTAAAHLAYLESISHEIRTPLNALQGGLEQLRDIPISEEAEQALNLVREGACELSALFASILAYHKQSARACSGIFHWEVRPRHDDYLSLPILVVDDIKTNRLVITHIMKNLGFQEIDLAESGEEALELWNQKKHQLVLLDYQMDGIDGYETCRRIRRSPAIGRPTIVGVSACALPENIHRALQAGFCAQVPKPVTKDLIRQTLQSLGWQFPEVFSDK